MSPHKNSLEGDGVDNTIEGTTPTDDGKQLKLNLKVSNLIMSWNIKNFMLILSAICEKVQTANSARCQRKKKENEIKEGIEIVLI